MDEGELIETDDVTSDGSTFFRKMYSKQYLFFLSNSAKFCFLREIMMGFWSVFNSHVAYVLYN